MQLSAKALIQLFNAGMTPAPALEVDDNADSSNGDMPSDDEEGDDDDSLSAIDEDDVDDGFDEMAELSATDQETLINEMQAVQATVSKLCNLSFAIIHSTTKALPAWKWCCRKLKKKALLIPRDVITHWNSTYDMLTFSLQYRESIDAITADKTMKLRKYELDDGDWAIVEDFSCHPQGELTGLFFVCTLTFGSAIQGRHPLLLPGLGKHSGRHPCHGLTH